LISLIGDVMTNIVNGLDVDKLNTLIEAIKADPGKGHTEFMAKTSWLDGAHSKTKIRDFVLEADEPQSLLGSDTIPNAVELVLASLGSCLIVGFAYNATAMGIRIRSLDIDIKGNLDLRGFLGISDSIRPGYQKIVATCRIDSDVSQEKLEELCRRVHRTSPVGDIVSNVEPVEIILDNRES
jgi:uncharacterized OsmC-like protein